MTRYAKEGFVAMEEEEGWTEEEESFWNVLSSESFEVINGLRLLYLWLRLQRFDTA